MDSKAGLDKRTDGNYEETKGVPSKLEEAFVYSSSLIRVLSLLVYDMRQKYTETTHLFVCTGALSQRQKATNTT